MKYYNITRTRTIEVYSVPQGKKYEHSEQEEKRTKEGTE